MWKIFQILVPISYHSEILKLLIVKLKGYVNKVKTQTYDYIEWISKLLSNKPPNLRYKNTSRQETDTEENKSVKNEGIK